MTAQEKVLSLFAAFVRLRQQGYTQTDAWREIEPESKTMDLAEQRHLFGLLRHWEAREGRYLEDDAQRDGAPDHYLTEPRRAERLDKVRASVREPAPPDAPADDAPQPFVCAKCGYANSAQVAVCARCGQPIEAGAEIRPGYGTRPIASVPPEGCFFGDQSLLFVQVQGAPQALRLQPTDQEIIFGRSSPESVMLPDVDLAPYNAYDYGVSRLHASLRRVDDTLVLSDLDSMNHTYVNGQQLHPLDARVISDGDEVVLARLVMRFHFYHMTP